MEQQQQSNAAPFRRPISASGASYSRQYQHEQRMQQQQFAPASPPNPPPLPVFPPTFLPFLRSSAQSQAGLTFESLLAYWSCQCPAYTGSSPWNDQQRDPASHTFYSLSVQSFPWALDRALRRDWETARSLLLNGAFLEQAVRSGGIRYLATATTTTTAGIAGDRKRLYGHYYDAVEAACTNGGTMEYIVDRIHSKEDLERVMKRHAVGVSILRGGSGSGRRAKKAATGEFEGRNGNSRERLPHPAPPASQTAPLALASCLSRPSPEVELNTGEFEGRSSREMPLPDAASQAAALKLASCSSQASPPELELTSEFKGRSAAGTGSRKRPLPGHASQAGVLSLASSSLASPELESNFSPASQAECHYIAL